MPAYDPPMVLILGAGINGCAVARELVLNGVSTCIVDRADVATGATAKSSRLIHGGLRYLEYGEFDLVRESLDERTRLLRLAPHYVEPLRLFIPIVNRTGGFLDAARRFLGRPASKSQTGAARGLYLVRMGLWLYDFYVKDRTLPKRHIHDLDDPDCPRVDPEAFRWLASYSDAQMLYPERFVLALLEDACRLASEQSLDFRVLTYHEVRMQGATAEVVRTGAASEPTLRFQPALIVNATGAWGDRTLEQLGAVSPRLFGGTKGSHFLTRSEPLKEALRGQAVYAEAPDGRLVFVLPAGKNILVGTTDVVFHQSPDQAIASPGELDYLLAMVASIFPQVKLGREDIAMHYCGVRPLPFSENAAPDAVTRDHRIEETSLDQVPVLTLVGGKLTTGRAFAEATADRVFHHLGIQRTADSRDRVIPGGENYPADSQSLHAQWERLAHQFGRDVDEVRAVWDLLGTRTAEVFSRISNQSDERLDAAVLSLAFARWVAEHEWVSNLSDLVERRLMLLYHEPLTRRCLEQLAGLLVETGRITPREVDECIAQARERLLRVYGKKLEE